MAATDELQLLVIEINGEIEHLRQLHQQADEASARLTAEEPEIYDLRPALFSSQTARMLDEFRRFRHVTHHAYAIQFDWKQMSELLSQAGSLLDGLVTDAEAFKMFLVEAGAGEK